MANKVESDKIDPFDPASLRIDPSNELDLGVKKVLTHVAVRKPHRQEFVRTHLAAEYRCIMAVLELKEVQESYLVDPSIARELPAEIRLVDMRLCTTRAGTLFLWPVALPAADGRTNPWHQTARAAAELAETQWIRMASNRAASCYDVAVAASGLSEPKWPEESFRELLRLAFGNGRFIDRIDHPVLMQLLHGE
jgi:hypothetical protein